MTEETTRLRLNLISEVALAADGAARPIHILRTGTFTSMGGREVTFTPEHIQQIAQNFSAGRRRKPPITERHDFGRAVGRIEKVWADGENLFAQPKWNKTGAQLLSDEVYDGFSCELDDLQTSPFLIGGSLTNYPAVDGLEPVTLSAPPVSPASNSADVVQAAVAPQALAGALLDIPTTQPTTEVAPMSEPLEQAALPGVPPAAPAVTVPTLPPPTPPAGMDAALQAQLHAYVTQMTEWQRSTQAAAFQQAQAELERRTAEIAARGQIEAFARARTTTTTDQPYAIPCSAEELNALLLATPSNVRGQWQTLLTRITSAGLLSFDEIGSSGEGSEAADQWSALVNAKVGAGMSRVEAIRQVSRDHPALYNAQTKKGGR